MDDYFRGHELMNKAELIDRIAEKVGLSKADAGRTLDAVHEIITHALALDDVVTLIGFGTYLVRNRAARTGRDPQTGNPIQIKASKLPAFRPGKALKDAVNHKEDKK